MSENGNDMSPYHAAGELASRKKQRGRESFLVTVRAENLPGPSGFLVA